MNLHLYIYTYPLTINIPITNNYSDFQQAHFLTVHKRIMIPAIKPIPNPKPYTQKSRNKTGGLTYDPIPHPGAAGAGAFTYRVFATGVALSRCLQGLGLRTLGQAGFRFYESMLNIFYYLFSNITFFMSIC